MEFKNLFNTTNPDGNYQVVITPKQKDEISKSLMLVDVVNHEIDVCEKMHKLSLQNSHEAEQRYWESRKIDMKELLVASA